MRDKNKLKKDLEEGLEDFKDDSEVSSKELKISDHPLEIKYLCELHNITNDNIRLVYISAIEEKVIYLNGKFLGYIDLYFYQEMDQYNNNKKV